MERLLAVTFCALLAHAPCHAIAANFVFTNIADTTTSAPVGTFSGLYNPSISNGVVAFGAQYSGGTLEGIFTGGGGPIATIAKEGDSAPAAVFTDLGSPSISDGRVTFYGKFDNGKEGIFVDRNGLRTTVAKTGDLGPTGAFTFLHDPVSSGDNVAFVASATGGSGIYISKDGVLSAIAKIGDLGPTGTPFNGLGQPAISGDNVAFAGSYPSPSGNGVFVGNGGTLTTIVKTGDTAPVGTFGGGNNPTINGNNVAFTGSYGPLGGQAIAGAFLSSGGVISPIALAGDPAPFGTFDQIGPTGIRDDLKLLEGIYGGFSNIGVFTYKGGSLMPVIKTGDFLFGSTVMGVGSAEDGLDSDGSGRIAFVFGLADGRSGIAMATPVPEFATFTLLTLGLMFGGFVMRRRR